MYLRVCQRQAGASDAAVCVYNRGGAGEGWTTCSKDAALLAGTATIAASAAAAATAAAQPKCCCGCSPHALRAPMRDNTHRHHILSEYGLRSSSSSYSRSTRCMELCVCVGVCVQARARTPCMHARDGQSPSPHTHPHHKHTNAHTHPTHPHRWGVGRLSPRRPREQPLPPSWLEGRTG